LFIFAKIKKFKTMKTTIKSSIYKTALIATFLTFCAHSCEKPKPQRTLPPETQEGNNTFGCYVNEDLFFLVAGSAGFGNSILRANYLRSQNLLSIHAHGKFSDVRANINLYLSNPEENIKKELRNIILVDKEKRVNHGANNTGEIILTRFDPVNRIISGVFSFEIPYSHETKDSVIRVTQGRFDIRTVFIVENLNIIIN